VTTYLLDVNVLLALFDPNHVSHDAAHSWFETVGHHSWATCPMTEIVVRVASHPSYPSRPGGPREVLDLLRRFCAAKGHQSWPDMISLLDEALFQRNVPIGHNQSICLPSQCGKKGKLASFDRRIPTAAVRCGVGGMEIIPA
jgi:predicted nucleic acid-binding protein